MRRAAAHATVILLLLAVDQWTKYLARVWLARAAPKPFGILTLLYTENRGAFLSLGSNFPEGVRTVIFDVIVALGLTAAAVFLLRGKLKRGDEIAVALIVGGGVGNLIDRLRFAGRVTDFLYLAAGPLHTGVFNVADMAITFGILWLLISWCMPSRRAQDEGRVVK